jgi:hypothetical protein
MSEHSRKEIDKLTRMLCGLCGELEAVNYDDEEGKSIFRQVKGLPKWWETHKRQDAQRLAKEREDRINERKKKAALKKLTKEERKLLKL